MLHLIVGAIAVLVGFYLVLLAILFALSVLSGALFLIAAPFALLADAIARITSAGQAKTAQKRADALRGQEKAEQVHIAERQKFLKQRPELATRSADEQEWWFRKEQIKAHRLAP